MNLVVDQVVQLQHVHVANGNRLGVRLTGTAIEQGGLAVGADQTVAVAVRSVVDSRPFRTSGLTPSNTGVATGVFGSAFSAPDGISFFHSASRFGSKEMSQPE